MRSITPDNLYYDDSPFLTIVWGPRNKIDDEFVLFTNDTYTHSDMLTDLDWYNQLILDCEHSPIDPRDEAEKFALMGRVGFYHAKKYVAFWNQKSELDKWLIDCLVELLDRGLISDSTIVSTAYGMNRADSITGKRTPHNETTRYTAEQWALLKKIHLMRGDEKKAAMQQLGLGSGGNKHKWQKALEKAGAIGPGQKWWAPNSENINRLSDLVD